MTKRQPIRNILLPLLAALAVRLIIACIADTPTVLSDEVDYYLAARGPTGHPGILSTEYPPLYAILLSSVAKIGPCAHGYLLCRVLNALLSALIVPLTWPLWRRWGMAAGMAVGLLPSGIITSGLLLSENLFVVLCAGWLLCAAHWMETRKTSWGLWFGALAALSALSRAAGGGVVLATIMLVVLGARGWRKGIASPLLAALIPVFGYLVLRQLYPPEQFNDPLAVGHPPEIGRWFTASLADMAGGTLLEPLARAIPFAPLFTGLWFIYWLVQYGFYLLLGTAFLPLAFLKRENRASLPTRRFLLPLGMITIIMLLLSANHNLAGKQAEQFVRGRYLEPLLPLWLALSLAALSARARMRLPWQVFPLFLIMSLTALTTSQNRSADFLYPLRSLLLNSGPGFRFWGSLAGGAIAFLVVRIWLSVATSRRWLVRGLFLFICVSGMASTFRYQRQLLVAQNDAIIAHWLAENDQTAEVTVAAEADSLDSLKASGLAWVVQQIRFFSSNPLVLGGGEQHGDYLLEVTGSPTCDVCTQPSPGRGNSIVCLRPLSRIEH